MASGIVGVIKYCRPTIRQDIRALMRTLVANATMRAGVNAVYHTLPLEGKAAFHDWFWDVFRDRDQLATAGSWSVSFCERRIRVPLKPESMGLDFGISTALLGHDVDIKRTYASLITGPTRPELFVDVGSNFGTHSILFAAHCIRTLSLDPNDICNRYHGALCAANGFNSRIETVAVGDRDEVVELKYPPNDPWLGSTDLDTSERLQREYALETCRVEQRTVDHYLSEFGGYRLLLKIDTEGNEHRVLLGAERTLRQKSPPVLFECWSGPRRREVHDIFTTVGYRVAALPWDGRTMPRALSVKEFLDQPATNFIGIPAR